MWNERYSQADYVYGKKPNDFLVEVVQQIPKGRVLCLSDGEGRNGVYLAQQGCQVTAVDASPIGLEKAQKLAAERSVAIKTIVADLAEFPIQPDAWDVIVSIFYRSVRQTNTIMPMTMQRNMTMRVSAGAIRRKPLWLQHNQAIAQLRNEVLHVQTDPSK